MFLVKQFTDQCIEFVGTRDEIRGQVLAHERDMWLLATSIQVVDKLLPFMLEVVEVRAAHPVREAIEVKVSLTLDRIDAYPLLPRVSPLFAHRLRLHAHAILPEGNVLSLQPLPQLRSKLLPVRASIGEKDARGNACVRARLPGCRHPVPLREVMGMPCV